LLAVVAAVPLCLAVTIWSEKRLVHIGLLELWGGTRRSFGLVLLVSAVAVALKGSWRSRTTLALTFAILPVFAYLKGAEQMEIWSQRRLIPVVVIGIVALLPAAAQMVKPITAGRWRWRTPVIAALCILVLALGTSNARRWPAPYCVRADKGAWEWTAAIREEIGTRLTFFDYYPASVPLSTDGRTRALSPGMERPQQSLPDLLRWVRGQSLTQEVLLITTRENPGIEEGIGLKELDRKSAVFDRVESRGCLPAMVLKEKMNWTITRVEPLTPDRPPPALHKVMDGGLLCLRPPWRMDKGEITTPSGEHLIALWSREGSGVLGPVPAPGQSVKIRISAISGRSLSQTLLIQAPWSAPVIPVVIQSRYSVAEVEIPRPLSDTNRFPLCTGIYRLSAKTPYDPTLVGFLGWERDLGALIHAFDISVQ